MEKKNTFVSFNHIEAETKEETVSEWEHLTRKTLEI